MGTDLTVEQILEEMTARITGLENKVLRLRSEDRQKDNEIQQIRDQVGGTAGNESFMAMLKAFFEQKELKLHVPELHDWEGDQKGFKTFKRECEAWLVDRKVKDPEKLITLVTGYMKGLATQWYTINQKARELAENPWVSKKTFWKEVKERFGDVNPNFTAQTKLEVLKQGQKSVLMYNSMFNEYTELTGYNEVALINTYYGRLNNDILCKIFNKENVPSDISGAQGAAIRIENLEQQLEQFTSSRCQEAPVAKHLQKRRCRQSSLPPPLPSLDQALWPELLAPWTSTELRRRVCAGIAVSNTCLDTSVPPTEGAGCLQGLEPSSRHLA